MSETEEINPLSADEQDLLREQIRNALGGRTLKAVTVEIGLPYGTVSSWMGRTYSGNTSRVALAVRNWLNAQSARVRVRATMPTAPRYVDTPTARAVISGFETAQIEPDFVLIAGGAGVGKTTAALHYQANNPNVWILTGEPCFSTPRAVLKCLASVLGITERDNSQTVSQSIQRRLRGSGGLIILDEAQHLSSVSLDQMRTLYDLAGVGVVLMGNETVYTRVEGHSRAAQFAQLYRRVGMRVNRKAATRGDIDMVLDAWGIEGAARKVLYDIGKKPGYLGNVTKTLRRAHMMADGEPVTAETLGLAWENISGVKWQGSADAAA